MKGLIALLFCFLTVNVFASTGIRPGELTAIKLTSGEVISKLTKLESTKVLKSLDLDQNIEIRERVIYKEEIEKLIVTKLTKIKITEKRPNQQDYN